MLAGCNIRCMHPDPITKAIVNIRRFPPLSTTLDKRKISTSPLHSRRPIYSIKRGSIELWTDLKRSITHGDSWASIEPHNLQLISGPLIFCWYATACWRPNLLWCGRCMLIRNTVKCTAPMYRHVIGQNQLQPSPLSFSNCLDHELCHRWYHRTWYVA